MADNRTTAAPRTDLSTDDITVEDGDESGERVYAITINKTSDLVEDWADRPNERAE